jgi:hypothetical protein
LLDKRLSSLSAILNYSSFTRRSSPRKHCLSCGLLNDIWFECQGDSL